VSRHRATALQPRYGRLAALGSSLSVTLIAVLGGTGVLPSAAGGDPPAADLQAGSMVTPSPTDVPEPEVRLDAGTAGRVRSPATEPPDDPAADPAADTTLPPGSGSGRRIVFSESRQRVWLVPAGRQVERTYLVSGSLTDNLDPGTYEIYSRSEQAWGIEDSGTMRYFARFTQGDTGAAIGFHDIPIDDGRPVQSIGQLGTPQSHGCIRQRRADAIALWDFAPIGTKVVVTA
jgi:L,D-transpeptidase catalytic domain